MTHKIHSLSLLYLGAMLVGGLTLSATAAQASTCTTDVLSGICESSAPAQPKAVTSTVAQADACDQLSGACQSEQIRSIDWQPTQVAADYRPCDQLSGVCAPAPSAQTERAHQAAKEQGHQATRSIGVDSRSLAVWWGAERPIGTL